MGKMVRIVLATALLLHAEAALGGGMALHLWQTEKGVEKLRNAELKRLLQKNRNAWMSGSSYPDSGYSPEFFKEPKYEWGEISHWGPFQHAYLDHVKSVCAGRTTRDAHCGRLVAHFLGSAAHGLQDQIFDELFVMKVEEMEGHGQEATDTGLDMILLVEHPSRLKAMPVPYYAPAEDLEKVYRKMGLTEAQANEKQIQRARLIMQAGHLGERFASYPTYIKHKKNLPWGSKNYMKYVGGVEFGGQVTARLWEYLWDRLHGREGFAPNRLTTVPAAGATNVAPDHPKTDSKVTVVFDRAIIPSTVNENTFYLLDPAGKKVPGYHRFIYRKANATFAEGHVAAFVPSQHLQYNATYRAVLTSGILDDRNKPVLDAKGYSWQFRTQAEPPYRTLRVGDLCLEAEAKKGAELRMARCSGAPTQHWLRDRDNRFHSRASENLCIDAVGSLKDLLKMRSRVVLWTCHGRPNQKWHDGERGSLRLGLLKKLALEVAPPVKDGARPRIRFYGGKDYQRWTLSKELGAAGGPAAVARAAEPARRAITFGGRVLKPIPGLPPR
jgi:hypothetical protein